jgi:hypothetical protein
LVLVVLLALAAPVLALSACGDSPDAPDSVGASAASPGAAGLDMGVVDVVDPDPSSLVRSDLYGPAAADNVLVVMDEGRGRGDAEGVAAEIGGTVVGEIGFVNLYQIQTSGSSAADLETAVAAAEALPGVKYAAPNGLLDSRETVLGTTCSPLRDPVYESDRRDVPYAMIGMMEAWAVIRASQATLRPVHVGVVDSVVYTGSPELHFPDAGGAYPAGKVRIRGLEAKDTTGQAPADGSGLTHGTAVTQVIAADWGDGVTGVAAGLGDKLTVSCGNKDIEGPLPEGFEPSSASDYELFASGWFGDSMAETVKLIREGAEVINLSHATRPPSSENPGANARYCALYKEFLRLMHLHHPRVLFVAAAGQENAALDGDNFAPGGIRAPNLITVGMLDRSGDRAKASDVLMTEEELADVMRQLEEDGRIPEDMTVEDVIDRLDELNAENGSNYATGAGEVTLSACGVRVPVGRDANGEGVIGTGTSYTTPQVTAAAAMMKALDPSLEAEEIKEILVRTAATEVTVGGTRVTVPAEVGGRVLRVDEAVLEVINRQRPADDQFILGDLVDLMTIGLSAVKNEFGWAVTASVPRVEGAAGVDLSLSLTGGGEVFGELTQHRDTAGDLSWTVAPGEDPVTVRVVRLDNGACASLELPAGEGPSVVYEGEVGLVETPPLDPYELTYSKVVLEVSGEVVTATVEFTLVAGLKRDENNDLVCTATITRVYKGEGPLTRPLHVELDLIDYSNALEGSDCEGVTTPVIQSHLLEGSFSEDGRLFSGHISNAWSITAARVETSDVPAP